MLFAILTACQGVGTLTIVDPNGSTTTSTTTTTVVTGDPSGQCGEVTTHDMVLRVAVQEGDRPARGVDVWLEDRGWAPGTIMATGVTNDEGQVTMDIDQLTSVEDCWSSLLDYVIVAEDGDLYAERGISTPLYNAILNTPAPDIPEVDLTGTPLLLE